eukprot:6606228-Pyramimonas_sp.AAC.1
MRAAEHAAAAATLCTRGSQGGHKGVTRGSQGGHKGVAEHAAAAATLCTHWQRVGTRSGMLCGAR